MTDKQGTRDKLGEVDLNELGTLEVLDDGDTDACIITDAESDFGSNLKNIIYTARRMKGDDWVMEQLGSRSGSSGFRKRQRAFSCSDCNRTWPGKDNQNPGDGPDLCPECDSQ